MNCNLLTDPFLNVRLTDGSQDNLSLPGLLALLQRDEMESYSALLPHQSHSWHAFLCQLGALALEPEPLPESPPGQAVLPGQPTEEAWLKRLRSLTPGFSRDEPWRLVVDDLSQPAFMQPPVPEGSWDVFRNQILTPDDLDVLVTARNHGVKATRMLRPKVENWVYALVSYQTYSGYSGSTHYSIARQNSNIGSRAGVSLVSRSLPGGQWARDVRVILENPEHAARAGLPFDRPKGLRLLWLAPWDGQSSLTIDQLHPLFIEISRRLRLKSSGSSLLACQVGTKTSRVAAKELKGNLADPWIPIRVEDGAAFNSRPQYKVVKDVLLERGKYSPSLLQGIHSCDNGCPMAVRFRILIRGMGKTHGYYERLIPIPPELEPFAWGERLYEAAEMAQKMVDLASNAEWRVLKPALLRVMQATRKQVDLKQTETSAWAKGIVTNLDEEIDYRFFPILWDCLKIVTQTPDFDQASEPWRLFLIQETEAAFRRGVRGLPLPGALRHRAEALGEMTLRDGISTHLKAKQIEKEVQKDG